MRPWTSLALLALVLLTGAAVQADHVVDLGFTGVDQSVYPASWSQPIQHTTGPIDVNYSIHAPQTIDVLASQAYLEVKGVANGTGTLVLRADVDPAPDPDLLGWWRLDELVGSTALDSSGNGNDGTLIGGVTLDAEGQVGSAFDFEGGYVLTESEPIYPTGEEPVTITAWALRQVSYSVGSRIVTVGSSEETEWFTFRIDDASGRIGVGFSTASAFKAVDPNPIGLDTWIFYAGIWDGVSLTLMRGCDVVAGPKAVVGVAMAGMQLAIGSNTAGLGTWTGLIDDARIYARALTMSEVCTEYQRGLAYQQARCEVPLNGPTSISVHCPAPPFVDGHVLRLQAEATGAADWTASYSWQQTDVDTMDFNLDLAEDPSTFEALTGLTATEFLIFPLLATVGLFLWTRQDLGVRLFGVFLVLFDMAIVYAFYASAGGNAWPGLFVMVFILLLAAAWMVTQLAADFGRARREGM